ncbi:hypothetical protein [Desertivirga arenae]|uniref:hypothetical protein n=1 Tax=Desertivirga arenae TaxID=2810309 RepID=UPI001A96F0A4|nr:hypothetical protein [Pedobacter sp. SYSU D00823]
MGISESLQQKFYQVLKHQCTLPDFEKWVYATRELEEELPADVYLELISLNYNDKFAYNKLEKILNPFIEYGKFEMRRIVAILNSIINRDENCADSIRMTYELYWSGYNFLQLLGLKYGLSVSCPAAGNYQKLWEEISREEQEELLNELYPEIVQDAQQVISWIEDGKVVIKETVDERGRFDYEDLRSAEEIKMGEF